MQAFTVVTGAAAPLVTDNVDTDVIIRIERLVDGPRARLGRYAFEALRYRADSSEDPGFVLNRPQFRDAPILLGGANFGCGSSREGAVWALMGRGIVCVIATSFGGIFFANCFQNGILPITLPASRIADLASRAADGAPVTVDLLSQRITAAGGLDVAFAIDPRRRESLLSGLDEIGLTQRDAETIAAWQQRDRSDRPWIWNFAANPA